MFVDILDVGGKICILGGRFHTDIEEGGQGAVFAQFGDLDNVPFSGELGGTGDHPELFGGETGEEEGVLVRLEELVQVGTV